VRLLLVEDDSMLVGHLKEVLTHSGFIVEQVDNVRNAKAYGLQEDYRIVILDMGLPDGNGLDVLRYWREKRKNMPVLILTARDSWQDKVNGLKAGADDYLAKPFHTEELIARLSALIRRSEGRVSNVICVRGYQLDEDSQRICTPHKTWHPLTGTEFRLLRCLMGRPNRVFSKEELLEQLYTLDEGAGQNNIEAYVKRIRKLLGKEVIATQRGQGYVFYAED
jgi:DNA-binding response OmpR family regulator